MDFHFIFFRFRLRQAFARCMHENWTTEDVSRTSVQVLIQFEKFFIPIKRKWLKITVENVRSHQTIRER